MPLDAFSEELLAMKQGDYKSPHFTDRDREGMIQWFKPGDRILWVTWTGEPGDVGTVLTASRGGPLLQVWYEIKWDGTRVTCGYSNGHLDSLACAITSPDTSAPDPATAATPASPAASR